MKNIEQTSTQLTLKSFDSLDGLWRYYCFFFAFLLLLLIIFEKIPRSSSLFGLVLFIWDILTTANKTVYLDKVQNQGIIKIERLLGTKKIQFPFELVRVNVKKTSAKIHNYSLNEPKLESIYVVVLEIPAKFQKFQIYGWENEAFEMATLIKTFLNQPL